jgi:hypothetical protein
MWSFALLLVFLACALIYARANQELVRLDKLRLAKEPPKLPDTMPPALKNFIQRIGMPKMSGSDELKDFCARNGLTADYDRANRRLYGSILVGLACCYFILKIGPQKL